MYYPAATKDYERYVSSSPQDAQLPYPLPPPTGIPVSTTATTFYTETTQTQPTAPPKKKPKEPWSSGLFGCFSDVKNCCITCWCPCITFGQIAEIVDKGSSSCGVNGALYTLIACVTGCCCCYSCFYRSKMRQQYSLKETPCWDCLVHCFCEYCALCQEYRELQFRGFDMPIGWHGNVERKNRGVSVPQGEEAVAPTVEEGMSRYD